MTTTTTTIPETPEFADAKSSWKIHAENGRLPLDVLFGDWLRIRRASSLRADDPYGNVTFHEVIDAVITARISGTAAVLPVAKGKVR
jgi:hypothetical protein